MNRDKLVKNITIIENFSKWLCNTNVEDYDYYNADDNPENESIFEALDRIVRNMEKDLERCNKELLEKYKNRDR